MKKYKLLIFVVAYNHEKTIESVIKRIPKKLTNLYVLEILIIDDASSDKTFEISKKIQRNQINNNLKVKVFYNPINQGYGGNQKIGYHYSIKNKFDFVVLLHGDGQYAPEELPKLLNGLQNGKLDVVIGSRMIKKKNALKGGMPLYKLIGNIILTKIQNFLLLIIISLYPGSILGFLLYGDFRLQPQITKDFLYISSQHLYVYLLVSTLGFFSYLRDKKFNLVIIYLFFLSIILEVSHLVISERSFQILDLTSNILGVLIAYIVVLIYKFWRK